MYHVYVLKSLYSDHFYVGQTDNLRKRLELHNLGKVKSSSRFKPWKIHYIESSKERIEALKRERYFKSHAGRDWLKKRLGP